MKSLEKCQAVVEAINTIDEGIEYGYFTIDDISVPRDVWEDVPWYPEQEYLSALFYCFDTSIRICKDICDEKRRKYSAEADVMHDTYRGKTGEEYEELRMESLQKIFEEEDSLKKVELAEEYARPLVDASEYFGFKECYDAIHESSIKMKIVKRLLQGNKMTATDIMSCVGVKLSDVYAMAKWLEMDLESTAVEKDIMQKENEKKTYRLTMDEDDNLVMRPNFDEAYANSEEVMDRERVNLRRLCEVLGEN